MNTTVPPVSSGKVPASSNNGLSEKGKPDVTVTTSTGKEKVKRKPVHETGCSKGLKTRKIIRSEKAIEAKSEKKRLKTEKIEGTCKEIDGICKKILGLVNCGNSSIDALLDELFKIDFGDTSGIGKESKLKTALENCLKQINEIAKKTINILGDDVLLKVVDINEWIYLISSGEEYNIKVAEWNALGKIIKRKPTEEEQKVYDMCFKLISKGEEPDKEMLSKLQTLVLWKTLSYKG